MNIDPLPLPGCSESASETSFANHICTLSTPGYKFADWEMKGVPLRLEFGPKDAAASVVSYARRDTGSKGTFPIAELATQVSALLETIQQDMYNKADASYKAHRLHLTDWEKVVPALDARNVLLIPFCEEPVCEEQIKDMTKSEASQELGPDGLRLPSMGMKSLCIPFEQVRGCGLGEWFGLSRPPRRHCANHHVCNLAGGNRQG